MKRILIILIGLLSVYKYNAHAKEYIFNGYGISKQYSIDVSDDYKFSSYTSEGMWDDSDGNFGNFSCVGWVKNIKDKESLEVNCEALDNENDRFWVILNRNSEILNEGKVSKKIRIKRG